jgi:hypothetical protein
MPPILFGLRLELILGHRCCIIDRGIRHRLSGLP